MIWFDRINERTVIKMAIKWWPHTSYSTRFGGDPSQVSFHINLVQIAGGEFFWWHWTARRQLDWKTVIKPFSSHVLGGIHVIRLWSLEFRSLVSLSHQSAQSNFPTTHDPDFINWLVNFTFWVEIDINWHFQIWKRGRAKTKKVSLKFGLSTKVKPTSRKL